MGKYSKIIDKLPKSFGHDADYQNKINNTKALILAGPTEEPPLSREEMIAVVDQLKELFSKVNLSLLHSCGGKRHGSAFAQAWRDLRRFKNIMSEWEYDINLMIEAYEQLAYDQYQAEGVTSLKLSNGDSVSYHEEPRATIKDRDLLRKWVMEAGMERSLQIPWQTINAITKERLLAGLPEPDGVVAEGQPKFAWRKGGE